MNNWNKRKGRILSLVLLSAAYNFYFIFLLPQVRMYYLLYLDFLLLLLELGIEFFEYQKEKKIDGKKKELLRCSTLIYREMGKFENDDIVEHEVEVLERQLENEYEANRNLQDYFTKWCHEVKIPLAACLLMNEKIEEEELRKDMREQLERINQQLNSALLGCKVQGNFFDIQVKPVKLMDCIRTSIQNNQFFLMKHHFEIEVKVEDVVVYTDKSWFVYVLDQLINNAVKYAEDKPYLRIWSCKTEKEIVLKIEDHGEGIQEADLRRIYEKGYTGTNHHNGKYKSTGMGLYMVSRIVQKLGHDIQVESEYGNYTRFTLTFRDNKDYFPI